MEFLSDSWINYMAQNYSIAIKSVPFVIYFLLKLWATLDPANQSNTVRDLLMNIFKTKEPK